MSWQDILKNKMGMEELQDAAYDKIYDMLKEIHLKKMNGASYEKEFDGYRNAESEDVYENSVFKLELIPAEKHVKDSDITTDFHLMITHKVSKRNPSVEYTQPKETFRPFKIGGYKGKVGAYTSAQTFRDNKFDRPLLEAIIESDLK